MGPTFSYVAWGCGKDQEEDKEDSSHSPELKDEEARPSNGVHHLPKDSVNKENGTSRTKEPVTEAASENSSTFPGLSVSCGSEETLGSRVVEDTPNQQSEAAAADSLHVSANAQLSTECDVVCPGTTESCDVKCRIASADLSSSSANVDTNTSNPLVSTQDSGVEEELNCHREVAGCHREVTGRQSSPLVEQTHCHKDTALDQETALEQQGDCYKESPTLSQDSSLLTQSVSHTDREETPLYQDTLGAYTNNTKEETVLNSDSSSLETEGETASSQYTSSEPQSDSHLENTTSLHDSSLVAQTDCNKEETASEQSTELTSASRETTGTEATSTSTETTSSAVSDSADFDFDTMATETTPPLASPRVVLIGASQDEHLPCFLSKEAETSSVAPAEDRLSSSESPEPCEESPATGETASKAAGGSGANGSVAAAGSKSEPDSKTTAAKTKKKEDKSIEYILRALSSLNSPEEKLAALCKKYADLHEEHRVLQTSFKSQQRKMTVGQREKDQLQAEHTKAVMAKSKLESLCRELQKQNKVVKEESILRQKEEEEKRKEISAKFQSTIGEIQTQMTENHEKNVKLREDNHELVGKLKRFLEQEELREQQMEKLTKHRELENQLAETKLAHAAAILKEQEDRSTKEKELLLLQTAESQKKNAMLEAQLNMYKERYEEFQGTINKSNDMFQKLKSEMDKMGKRIKKLEKEGAQWRAKWESSNKALLDMAEEKTRSDKEKHLLQTKILKLESLCRALQGEMHGNKTISPSPQPSSTDASSTTTTTATATAAPPPPPTAAASLPENSSSTVPPTSSSSTTATPPNTPEENTSRASPNPESPANTLPPGHNGPITASALSGSVPGSSSSCSTEEDQSPQSEAVGDGESLAATTWGGGDGEAPSSSCPGEGSVPDLSATRPSERAEVESTSSPSDPPSSSSQDEAV